MKTILIDFEDSFTFNIASHLKKAGLQVTVENWQKKINHDYDLYVLGPGPGHPRDYQKIFSEIKDLRSIEKKILGICLGHQILALIDEYEIVSSKNKCHGQQEKIHLNQTWKNFFNTDQDHIIVQRYNSLAVIPKVINDEDILLSHNEVMARKTKNLISYQFHPESIGTINPQLFFNHLRNFL